MGKLTNAEVKYWIKEVDSCLKRQEQDLVKRNNYPLLIKYYEGDMNPAKGATLPKNNRQRMSFINEYFPNVNQLIADIMFQNPDIVIEARKPSAEEGVHLMKSALQYAFDSVDALTENKLALFDMIMAGFAGIEVNHINLNPQKPEVDTTTGLVKKVKNMFGAKEEDEAEENLAKAQEPYEAYSSQDETYLKRWNPLDIILDYRAERLKDSRYRGKIIRKTPAEFNAMYPAFKNKVNADNATINYCQHTEDDHRKLITLYEIQVKDGDKYVNFVIAPSYRQGELDYFERPYTANGFNMKIGTLHEYGSLYPISLGAINKAVQDDINNFTTFEQEVAERNVPKRWYDKNKVKEDGLIALNSPTINESVPIDGHGETAIGQVAHTNVSVENKELMAIYQQTKEKLWTVSTNRLQGQSQAKFATELQIQEAGFQAGRAGIQEGVRKFLNEQTEMLKDIIVQFWDKPMWFKYTGSEGPQWYEPEMDERTGRVTNPLSDMLTGDYTIKIDIASSLRPNKEKKKKELMEFLNWLSSEGAMTILQANNKMPTIEFITRAAREFDLPPEIFLTDMPEQQPEPKPIGEKKVTQKNVKKDEIGNEQEFEEETKTMMFEEQAQG